MSSVQSANTGPGMARSPASHRRTVRSSEPMAPAKARALLVVLSIAVRSGLGSATAIVGAGVGTCAHPFGNGLGHLVVRVFSLEEAVGGDAKPLRGLTLAATSMIWLRIARPRSLVGLTSHRPPPVRVGLDCPGPNSIGPLALSVKGPAFGYAGVGLRENTE